MIKEMAVYRKIVISAGPEGRGADDRKRPLMYMTFRIDIGRSSKTARIMYVAARIKFKLCSSSSSSLRQMSSKVCANLFLSDCNCAISSAPSRLRCMPATGCFVRCVLLPHMNTTHQCTCIRM